MKLTADVLIIGAGIAGLSCAYHLKRDCIVLEKESVPGGLCQTDMVNGFYFDKAEHFVRLPNRKVFDFFKTILGNNFFGQELVSSIYYGHRFIPYPLQRNIYSLSNNDKLFCLKAFMEKEHLNREKKFFFSFGDWILRNYGKGIADIFMFPYNRKIWQSDPFKMRSDFSFNSNLIPKIELKQMLRYTLLSQKERNEESGSIRYYPKKGGINQFPVNLALRLKEKILYRKHIIRINLKQKEAVASDGTAFHYNTLVSTMPLVELGKIIRDIPVKLKRHLKCLKYTSIYISNFALKKTPAFKEHWIYFPEKDVSFVRMYFLKNFNASMCPDTKSSMSVLTACLPHKRFNFMASECRIMKYLEANGFLSGNRILFTHRQFVKYGMPIPTFDSVDIVNMADRFLTAHSVKTLGRYGLWKYQGIEHAIQDGQNINSILHL